MSAWRAPFKRINSTSRIILLPTGQIAPNTSSMQYDPTSVARFFSNPIPSQTGISSSLPSVLPSTKKPVTSAAEFTELFDTPDTSSTRLKPYLTQEMIDERAANQRRTFQKSRLSSIQQQKQKRMDEKAARARAKQRLPQYTRALSKRMARQQLAIDLRADKDRVIEGLFRTLAECRGYYESLKQDYDELVNKRQERTEENLKHIQEGVDQIRNRWREVKTQYRNIVPVVSIASDINQRFISEANALHQDIELLDDNLDTMKRTKYIDFIKGLLSLMSHQNEELEDSFKEFKQEVEEEKNPRGALMSLKFLEFVVAEWVLYIIRSTLRNNPKVLDYIKSDFDNIQRKWETLTYIGRIEQMIPGVYDIFLKYNNIGQKILDLLNNYQENGRDIGSLSHDDFYDVVVEEIKDDLKPFETEILSLLSLP